jgi:4-aminobutyrate aminotransferase / (S)-3-amino-2-methylpropionate transaminase / 5-aminovalerate transaminase
MRSLEFTPDRLGQVPGPKSLALYEQWQKAIPRGIYTYHPLFVRRAHDALVEDVDGNVLIDFAGGIGCLNAGSSPEEVVGAAMEQADRFLFSAIHVAPHEPYLALIRKLIECLPGAGPKKGMLANSGAEAVENAVKIARAFTKRQAIVTFQNSFHGRTFMALALTSKTKTYKAGFGPFPAEVYRLPFAYCYRCPIGRSYPDCAAACADLLNDAFENQVAAGNVAALIVEPIQGEGGFIVPPADYLQKLQAICRRHGILFMVDEIQTGIARTGSMFAFQRFGLDPDIVILSKSLAAGLPLSAVIGRAEILDSPQVGGLGGTFGGNPVACAAGLAVLERVERMDLCARASHIGAQIQARAQDWQKWHARIGDVRGIGAMVGIEFVEDRAGKEPATDYVARLRNECLRNGLLLITAGTFGNVVRFLPPLVIDDKTLHQGLDILEKALRK